MNLVNYQKEMETILTQIKSGNEGEEAPSLFLHSCCAPCSSYVLKYLMEYFRITVFYYNPNISEQVEYQKRVEEQKKLIQIYNQKLNTKELANGFPIDIVEGDYEPEKFLDMAGDYKDCAEGGKRCFLCYEMRLRETAKRALEDGFTYFATTLTISPLKNAAKINEIGHNLEKQLGILWLPSDFKKKDGYKQSVLLSGEYGLYRQDYCGCVYSKADRESFRK